MRGCLWLLLFGLLLVSVNCGNDSTSEPNESPDIDVTPASLSMTAQAGRDTTATLTVRNVGNATLNVTSITGTQPWLSANPTSFSVNAGSSRDVTVTASAASLSAGTYSGTITIASNDPDEATKTVGVTFTVTGGGTAQIEMIRIPGGTFQMGSTSQWAYSDEQPVHTVTVSAFYMSKYEVTQAQYQAVMGTNPSCFQGANRPVERVSWWNAAKFCNALSAREGRTPCYNESNWRCNFSADGYRLPTEAEWEYACRAGTTTDLYSGDLTSGYEDPNMNAIGWYWYNSNSQTHDVGGKQPNAFGLYDMSGNVWEWCNDWYGSCSSQAQTDPTGPSSGSNRVIRGGSWYIFAHRCRSAHRDYNSPGNSRYTLGFRLVRR